MKTARPLRELLRGLPLRRAPATLEFRVWQELERRAARPWWRRGFSHWPGGARASFVAVCCVIVGLTAGEGASTMFARTLLAAAAGPLSWTHATVAVVRPAGEVAVLLIRVIPVMWIYGGLAAGAVLYAALFGLTAAAYRTLYLQLSPTGERR